jgi:Tol biopolymer transport system component
MWAAGPTFARDEAPSWLIAYFFDDRLATAPAEGGASDVHALPEGEKANLAVSPDRKHLVFILVDPKEAKHCLMRYHVQTRKLDKLADLTWQPPRPITFSADGNLVAVVDANPDTLKHRVLLMNMKTGKPRKVLDEEAIWDGPVFMRSHALVWSTVSDRQLSKRLSIFYLGNGATRKLYTSQKVSPKKSVGREQTADNPCPLWVSPDGGKLLWLDWGKKFPTKRQLVLLNPRSPSPRYITDIEKGCLSAKFSPDGKWIAYVAFGPGPGKAGIFILKPGDPNAELVAAFLKQPYRGWMFSWSPDSKRIAYVHKEKTGVDQFREIYVVDIEEKEPLRITENTYSESYPVWVEKGRP